MEGIWEKIGKETTFCIFNAGNIADEAEGGAVSDAAYHGIQPNGLEFLQKGLGANPMVA